MPIPRILILRAPGTNCDHETAYAFEKAGGRAELVHINRLLESPRICADYQVLCLPGGFSEESTGRIAGASLAPKVIYGLLRLRAQKFQS